ncbi:amidinotransferase [Nitrogeniibacter mangrovi]|uniref:Amidinotransferase n=1 Tax=Nitrogeniibacter mangrovi TaxID=2016596 RepID=A0A6C1B2Y7_9RHOO|nr:arginine deiminase-related protein [Nitrogeniibacter mangrovi]QID16700.1 amidinotransferase [Nitrogeniibacter mangrovi]
MADPSDTAPHILLVDPAHFDVHYTINPWMQPQRWHAEAGALGRRARAGFDALVDTLERIGCRVSVMPGAPGLPDMVFPANAAVVLDGRALLARFRHAERQGEEAHFAELFERLRADGLLREVGRLPPGCVQEGAGDCIWDATRGQFWAGWGPRSSRIAADRLAAFFGQPVVPLELVTDRAYHLDVCFAPLCGGEVLWYPPALSMESRARVIAQVGADRLIAANEDELARFNVNAVNVGRDIVMSPCAPRLRTLLEGRGYRVHEVDVTPFMLAGGGAFCMTLRLDRQSPAAAGIAPASQEKHHGPDH